MNLTDTQLIVLGEASNRDDRIVVLPDRLKGNAATKVFEKLLKVEFVEEILSSDRRTVWRRDEETGTALALRITDAGLKAISASEGIGTDPSSSPVAEAETTPVANKSPRARSKKQAAAVSAATRLPKKHPSRKRKERGSRKGPSGSVGRAKRSRPRNQAGDPAAGTAPREGSKIAGVIDMLRRAKGASIPEIMSTTGWLSHTTRAALTGLRKRGLYVERTREPRGKETTTIYRIVGA